MNGIGRSWQTKAYRKIGADMATYKVYFLTFIGCIAGVIFLGGCAPFSTCVEENAKGGYNITQTGKLPRESYVEYIDETAKKKLTIKSDNKFKLIPTINASMFNFGGTIAKED